jgi:hypothetical protein
VVIMPPDNEVVWVKIKGTWVTGQRTRGKWWAHGVGFFDSVEQWAPWR